MRNKRAFDPLPRRNRARLRFGEVERPRIAHAEGLRQAVVANVGMITPLLWRNGKVQMIDRFGLPLGAWPTRYAQHSAVCHNSKRLIHHIMAADQALFGVNVCMARLFVSPNMIH